MSGVALGASDPPAGVGSVSDRDDDFVSDPQAGDHDMADDSSDYMGAYGDGDGDDFDDDDDNGSNSDDDDTAGAGLTPGSLAAGFMAIPSSPSASSTLGAPPQPLNTRVLFWRVPRGRLRTSDMRVVREPVAVPPSRPPANHMILRNKYVSIDPHIRTRMQESMAGYLEPFDLGQPLYSECVAEVIALGDLDDLHRTVSVIGGGGGRGSSRPGRPGEFAELVVGDFVVGSFPWEDWSLVEVTKDIRKVDISDNLPLSLYLSVFGWPGQTAYFGLFDIGQPRRHETILVSAGAGAVGQLVGQMAKICGLHVVASAGNDEKVNFMKEQLRYDGAFNYRTSDIDSTLAELAPRGIDIYFENVGGHLMEAVLPHMNVKSRIPLSGMISMYSDMQSPHSISNLYFLVTKQIRMEGFKVDQLPDESMNRFMDDMMRWYNEGRIVHKETVIHGLENAPEALTSVFQRGLFGKIIIK
ncbi:hypothetical protein HK405_008714, partial [Cladochytrium tenue]